MNWKTRQPVVLLSLVVFLLTLCWMPSTVWAEDALLLSPDSQTFIQSLSEWDPQAGSMIPDPISLSHATGQAVFPAITYPASYDLRTQGKLTSVKNQNPYGTCWAFASLASLESGLMPGQSWDFAENHLIRWSGFDNAPQGFYDHPGNANMAAAYLARWQGPVNEADSPYIDPNTPSVLPVQKHVQEVLFLPPRSGKLDNDNIKGALTTYGAVTVSMYWNDSNFNDATDAYYYGGGSDTNHLVDIVGWDNNYDKSRFTGASGSPSGNGAFIVRNSWGSAWGESGYFYLSYYDNVMGWFRIFNNAEAVTNFGRNYQYDPLGWVTDMGYTGQPTAWFANIFTAQAGESLAAVGFNTTGVNAAYEVYIKPNFNGSSFVGSLAKSGSFVTPGYHTVSFVSPIPVSAGSQFCVAVKMTTPAYNFPVPVESAVSGYSSGATSSPGQSYVSQSGSSWTDITTYDQTANVCLKAFTAPPPLIPTIGYSPSSFSFSATQGGSNPPAQTLEVWNVETGSLNWTASEGAGWLSLGPTSGSSTGEHDLVTVSVDASGLIAGTYTATITLSAAGASNTPRQVPVSLLVNPSVPRIGYSPSSLTFHAIQGQANPPSQALEIWNAGAGSLNWTVSEGVGWLSLGPTSGSSTGEHDLVTVSVDASGLIAGTYTATISIVAAGADNSPQSVGATLVVADSSSHTVTYSLQPNWNMISLPLTPASLDPQVVFGGLPSPWYLFEWNPLTGIYIGKESITLRLGAGYWLKVPTAVNYPVSGLPNGEAQSGINLGLNWNLIGVPYQETIPWGAVRVSRDGGSLVMLDQAVSSNWIQGMFFHWNSSSYDMLTSGGSFQSLFGYWLKAKVTGLQLVFLKP